MKTIKAVSYKQRLDHLFTRASTVSGDTEMLSHWARYLCIMVSGFIEESVCAIFSSYCQSKAAPNVANYACSRLERLNNPKMEQICQLAGWFSEAWRKTLEAATEGEIKDAVDSIVANRHEIAHGATVGISYLRVKEYYGRAVKMVEAVEAIVLGESQDGRL